VDSWSSISIECSDIHGNAEGDWVEPIEELLGQNGNICEAPLFCDPENGDFTLAEGSPCLPDFNPGCGLMGAHGVGCKAPAGVPSSQVLANGIRLYPNFPNPFNPVTTIRFELPFPQRTKLTVFFADGRRVVTLVDRLSGAGRQEAVWNGTDEHGRKVPSGVYFFRLEAGEYSKTEKMTLVK
jgi:hypothetical protein